MTTKLHAQWIVGFVDGEGCFRASIIKNQSMRFGYQIQMEFVVTQHKRDYQILYALKHYFQCGQVTLLKPSSQTNCYRWRVRKLSHLIEIIIPFFEKHSLKTKKNIEFLRFRDLCLLLNQKKEKTKEEFDYYMKLAKQIPYVTSEEELIKVELEEESTS